MFYYPNCEQAIRIQKTLESLYKSVQGDYHYADAAWAYVGQRTGAGFARHPARPGRRKDGATWQVKSVMGIAWRGA